MNKLTAKLKDPKTIAAFKSGKPVYVEKPMALNSSEAQSMLDASQKYSCKLSIGGVF